MHERARVIAHSGLRFRDSPRDGITLEVLAHGETVEVLGRETWVRVKHGEQVGFVLADFIEPVAEHGFVAPGVAPFDLDDGGKIVDIIEYPQNATIRGQPLRIDREFRPAIEGIEELANDLGLIVWITSSLREPYKPVAGAIVTPAKFSNHHIGHGIDMNLVMNDRWFRSTELGRFDSLPGPIQSFLDGVQSRLKLRWGGKFSTPDPVHIDDGLNLRDRERFDAKLAALWGAPRT
jgi:hypothetical protein